MTPKEAFGRPRILAGAACAILGGMGPSFLPWQLWEFLYDTVGPLVLLWLIPLVCAVGGGVAGGLIASSDQPALRKPYLMTFVASAFATAIAARFLGGVIYIPFVSWLLPILPGAVVAFFGLAAAVPSTSAVTGTVTGDAPPAGPLPFRSIAEEHLYMELRPCTCGRKVIGDQGATVEQDDKLVRRFAWSCAACGSPREFLFLIPESTDYLQTPDHSYGQGPAPSEIIDAGEFLAVSDRFAQSVPASVPDAEKAKAADAMGWAIAAMEEVLKFIPAGERATPPPSAMRSAASRRLLAQLPGQFERYRLEARLKAYRDLLETYRT